MEVDSVGGDPRIVVAPGDSGLWSVAPAGGDPEQFLPPAEGETDFHHVSVLPGDRGFLFHPHVDLGFDSIHLYDGQERRELLRIEGQQLNGAVYSAGHLVFARRPDNPGVWAVPFSLDELEFTGTPFLVQPDATFPAASASGDLAFAPGTDAWYQLVELDVRSAL